MWLMREEISVCVNIKFLHVMTFRWGICVRKEEMEIDSRGCGLVGRKCFTGVALGAAQRSLLW